jgi:hypothetical protein
MAAIHRGHKLVQPQLDCLTEILNEQLDGKHRGIKKFNEAFERRCREKGCPVPEGIGPHGEDPKRKR